MHNHPLWTALALAGTEGLNHLQTLEGFCLTLNGAILIGSSTKFVGKMVEVEFFQHVLDCLRTHHGDELIGVIVGKKFVVGVKIVHYIVVLFLRQQLAIDDVLFGILGSTRLNDDIAFVVDNGIQLFGRETQEIANLVRQ